MPAYRRHEVLTACEADDRRNTQGDFEMMTLSPREEFIEAVAHCTRRAEAEYREMPGLSLTLSQATRLWGLDQATCTALFDTLLKRGIVKRTADGRYIRVS